MALVTGGPATGKSVFVAQWFESLGPLGREWVTLDASDDRPERFWPTFTNALERSAPGSFTQAQAAAFDLHQLRPDFFELLLFEWSTNKDPLIVVLDDFHHVRNPAITDDLAALVEHAPRGPKIVLTSRVDPRMPIARWRGRSWLAEVRQLDLAFTQPETVSLLAALDVPHLTQADVEMLWRHTEGWVAGLRLAIAAIRDRADSSKAVAEFSGRYATVADLLAEEILHRAPEDVSEFLMKTSIADVLDADLCDAVSGRSDSGELLRSMEAELKFVVATGADRAAYRYHPLLSEMLRSELTRRFPNEVQDLNRRAAAIFKDRGDIESAVRFLLAAGDVDETFSIVFVAAYRRHDVGDLPAVAAFINNFPIDLVSGSAFRMLTYTLVLGLCGRAAEGSAWLQRAALRIANDPQPDPRDLAALDAIRLLAFATTGMVDNEIDAGKRAVEAIDQGIDLGILGARARMNLVRAYLLVDDPGEADVVLHGGSPGDEIATLLLAPALAARIALRKGMLTEAGRQAKIALGVATAFGLDAHHGAIDAHLARAGVLIDRNDLTEALVTIGILEGILQRYEQALPCRVLPELEKVRVAAAGRDFDDLFLALEYLHKLVNDHSPSPLRDMVDAMTARWLLEVGETNEAQELIARIPAGNAGHTILRARMDLAVGRPGEAIALITERRFATVRDQLIGELVLARIALASNGNAEEHVRRAVELAAPDRLVRVVLDEGPVVSRLARSAAEALRTEAGNSLARALGAPPRSHGALGQPTVDLSDRELSVLRYLPSRLTYAEIASECGSCDAVVGA
ncbi:MAG: hypothetical protein ACLP5O_13885 [Acidimicrobiales bacterium]